MGKLAIITRDIGRKSETFIVRHILDLNPGKTILVVENQYSELLPESFDKIPRFALNKCFVPFYIRYLNKLLIKIGIAPFDYKLYKLTKFLKLHNAQVIMAEYLDLSIGYISMAKKVRATFFAHAHGYDVSRLLHYDFWKKEYQRLADTAGVITINQESMEALKVLGIPEEKIFVRSCGVDITSIFPNGPTNNKQIRLLAVGRFVAKKAPVILLQIILALKQRNLSFHFDYVGDGPLMAAALEFVIANQMQDYVTLHGERSHEYVLDLMRKTDIFVQHSVTCPLTGDKEGLPVAILEAMAHQLPVVSTRHAGIPEVIDEGIQGYLVEEYDIIAMTEKISQLMESDVKRWAMGKEGRSKVKENFTWEHEKKALVEIMGL